MRYQDKLYMSVQGQWVNLNVKSRNDDIVK